ncbi:hypothetical protein [Antarcticirhabdus aurantiaca]|uniref:Uncharacterized protein n=1 Tax=Antarcticirhabdus aurantiaca TaxID=2606717 RepID=A0ACD4NW50_9HYPH|nr:hypothetical protein OXU80_12490 [Jeongeuplla avenae]
MSNVVALPVRSHILIASGICDVEWLFPEFTGKWVHVVSWIDHDEELIDHVCTDIAEAREAAADLVAATGEPLVDRASEEPQEAA